MREGESMGAWVLFHLLLHSPDGYCCQDWLGLKPELRTAVWVSNMGDFGPLPSHGWQELSHLTQYHCIPESWLTGSWSQGLGPGVNSVTCDTQREHLHHGNRCLLHLIFFFWVPIRMLGKFHFQLDFNSETWNYVVLYITLICFDD